MGAYRILNPKEKVSTIFALKSPGLGKRGGEVGSRKSEARSHKSERSDAGNRGVFRTNLHLHKSGFAYHSFIIVVYYLYNIGAGL